MRNVLRGTLSGLGGIALGYLSPLLSLALHFPIWCWLGRVTQKSPCYRLFSGLAFDPSSQH